MLLANEGQYLLIGSASLNDLQDRLTANSQPLHVTAKQFRPNLVISTIVPYEEDHWTKIRIEKQVFRSCGPCSRCKTINLDEVTSLWLFPVISIFVLSLSPASSLHLLHCCLSVRIHFSFSFPPSLYLSFSPFCSSFISSFAFSSLLFHPNPLPWPCHLRFFRHLFLCIWPPTLFASILSFYISFLFRKVYPFKWSRFGLSRAIEELQEVALTLAFYLTMCLRRASCLLSLIPMATSRSFHRQREGEKEEISGPHRTEPPESLGVL